MICQVCGSEFSIENFDICPYCMTPIYVAHEEEKNETISTEVIVDACPKMENENMEKTIQTSFCNSEDAKKQLDADLSFVQDEDFEITEADLFEEKENPIDIPIEMLGLSVRAMNAFRRVDIHTLNQLVDFLAVNDIANVRNVGAKTIQETEELLKKVNNGELFFKTDTEEKEALLYVFRNMSTDVDYLSISALSELGFTHNAISKLVDNGIRCCSELREFTIVDMKRILGGYYEENIIQLSKYLEMDIIALTLHVLENLREGRSFEVFLRRAKSETLQEIAENPYGAGEKITRERVRQLENKFLRRITPFIKEIVYILLAGEKFITTHNLLDVFDDDDYDQVMLYACQLIENFEYLDFADVLVEKKEISVKDTITSVISNLINTGVDLLEAQVQIDEALYEKGIDYISLEAVKNWLKQNGYNVYGDFATKGKGDYATICRDILKRYFPNGIKLSQNAQEQATDLIKMRNIARENYGGIELPGSDKSLSAILMRSGVVLCGRGQYILDERVIVNESIMLDIKEFIDKCPHERVFYNEIYANFEGLLNMVCGIDNYNYLHGVLALRFPSEYEYSRDYLLKNGISDCEAESIADRIYEFICKSGRPISKSELEQQFVGFSNVMLTMPFATDARLFQWEYNYYSCTGLIKSSGEQIVKVEDVLCKIFNENQGYASDALIFEALNKECQEFIEINGIKNEMNLHYTLSILLGDKYDFHRPHISKKGHIDISSTKNVAMYLMGYPKTFSYMQYMSMVSKMGWSHVTAGCVLSDLENDFLKISSSTYLHKSEFVVSEEIIDCVEILIRNEMKDGVLPLGAVNFENYPEWNYEWNEFVLETVLNKSNKSFNIIHPVMKDRRYQRGIIVDKEYGLESYSQVIAHKMKCSGYEKLSESQFLSFLVVNYLALKAIPNELNNSEFINKDNGYYYVK